MKPLLPILVLALLSASPAIGEEAAPGKQLFEKRCSKCHALDRNKEGPRLAGIYGRQAGTEPGFKYSKGLKAAGFVWDDEHLERWLIDPESVVRHANMDFAVARAEERAEIIRYLKSISPQQKTD